MATTLRIPFDEVLRTLEQILLREGFEAGDAAVCARLFTETTCDGVYTHGVARFPRLIATIKNGCVNPKAKPEAVLQSGVLERWDGKLGPGNLNAQAMMARAISLAEQHGMGCVALRNTNHWMRGGTYGWQAAEAGMIGLCWTNTLPNLPAWGGKSPVLGNNPLVVAVPRKGGHVVLDMAMSQFSFGTLAAYREQGRPLPVVGGYDNEGRLTRNAAAIEASKRPLPIGYWKGSGLSLVLDMMAALLSGGLSTSQIPRDALLESGLSQVFIAVNLAALQSAEESAVTADGILRFVAEASDAEEGSVVRYPGERVLQIRAENLAEGIPVEEALWQEVLGMKAG
jgi:3-dehydro-L-gulonate 2-dehydrogenase